jgi:RNA polymerase sigma-70 factor, ECF subfamily
MADPAAIEPAHDWLARHRAELTGYCYRMLGSAFEAEDAVQETLLRAWDGYDQFDEARGSLRAWLYAIATGVCLDLLRGRKRRARPVDLGPAAHAGAPLGEPLADSAWVEPIPDAHILPADGDPAELVVQRETIRLAFVAALQHLPPRQRAVLILREVVCWSAAEVAELLGTTVVAVNSALQRARATLVARGVTVATVQPLRPAGGALQELLARYADAFERYDVDALVALLHEDARMSMPPFGWWLEGRAQIRQALLGSDGYCRGSRLVPVAANGSPAFAQYTRTGPGGALAPWALVVVEVSGDRIAGWTSFLDAARWFPRFGLPLQPTLEPAP